MTFNRDYSFIAFARPGLNFHLNQLYSHCFCLHKYYLHMKDESPISN